MGVSAQPRPGVGGAKADLKGEPPRCRFSAFLTPRGCPAGAHSTADAEPLRLPRRP